MFLYYGLLPPDLKREVVRYIRHPVARLVWEEWDDVRLQCPYCHDNDWGDYYVYRTCTYCTHDCYYQRTTKLYTACPQPLVPTVE